MRVIYVKLLSNWLDEVSAELSDGWDELFDASDGVLLEFADKSESIPVRKDFLEARNVVHKHRKLATIQFQEELSRELDTVVHSPQEEDEQLLSLLEKDLYERTLALATIADEAERRNYSVLFALSQRLSVVQDSRPVEITAVPAHPGQLARVYQRVLEQFPIEHRALLVIHALFDRHLIGRLDGLYKRLDQQLVAAGILPNLKFQALQRPTADQQQPVDDSRAPNITDEGQTSVDVAAGKERAGVDTTTTPNILGSQADQADQALSRVFELLATQRIQQASPGVGGSPGAAPPATSPVVSPAAVPDVISRAIDQVGGGVQVPIPNTQAITSVSSRIPVNGEMLADQKSALVVQRQAIRDVLEPLNVPTQDKDRVEIVGMLFEVMLDSDQLPNIVKVLLSHLHTTYLVIAAKAPTFLNNSEHPAHVLFDHMVDAGERWVDERNLRSGIYPQLQRCVHQLLKQGSIETSFYEGLIQDLSKQIQVLEKKVRVYETRTRDTEQGKLRLEQARNMVQEALPQLYQEHQLIPECSNFLKTAWVDYMTLVLLRSDLQTDAKLWQQAMAIGKQLVIASDRHLAGILTEQQRANVINALSLTVGKVITHYSNAVETLDRALTEKVVSPVPPATPSLPQQEPETNGREETTKAVEPFTEEEEAYYAQICAMDAGVWFKIKTDDAIESRRLKLCWINPYTDHLLLVNQNGAKAALLPIRDLVRSMARGEASVLALEGPGFISRAFIAVRNILQKAVGTPDPKTG